MVENGVIPPFCDLLTVKDTQVVNVVLDGINNILKSASEDVDSVCQAIEECGGKAEWQLLILYYFYAPG